MKLTQSNQSILDYLVALLPSVRSGHPETYKTYGDVHRDLGLPGIPHELEHQGLGGLATQLHEAGLPGITGLIIRRDTLSPGGGFFRLYNQVVDDFNWWEEEIARVIAFDWSPYSKAAPRRDPPKTPVAADGKKTERVETTSYRILRDTPLARKIKFSHNYECQICGETIHLADGSRYAEAHHLQPLGAPHHGPDIAENIICLCPNHHALLDYFAIPLALNHIRTKEHHALGVAYIDYHNCQHATKKRAL